MYFRTVAFFGHRIVDDYFEIERQVEGLVREFLRDEIYIEFIVGRNGMFDELVASVVKRVKEETGKENCSLVLILPYAANHDKCYWEQIERIYDEIEVSDRASQGHYKAAFRIRNKEMIDRADIIVFYIKREKGGAYEAMKYAEKSCKKCIKLNADIEREPFR